MTTPIWTAQPSVLLSQPEFMYSLDFDANRNLNALARLVLIWVVVVVLMTRNLTVVVIGVMMLVLMRRAGPPTPDPIVLQSADATSRTFCQGPTLNNPLANPTPSDWGNGEIKLPACPGPIVKDAINTALASQPITGPVYEVAGDGPSTKLARRTFYSVPTSGVPDARDAFMHGLYGGNISRSLP
tara:strand:+ start:104 stop:658 length:555 start_codon:yes stop_codon:yes gene_type:complete